MKWNKNDVTKVLDQIIVANDLLHNDIPSFNSTNNTNNDAN